MVVHLILNPARSEELQSRFYHWKLRQAVSRAGFSADGLKSAQRDLQKTMQALSSDIQRMGRSIQRAFHAKGADMRTIQSIQFQLSTYKKLLQEISPDSITYLSIQQKVQELSTELNEKIGPIVSYTVAPKK